MDSRVRSFAQYQNNREHSANGLPNMIIHKKLITVVIPAYNEEHNIKRVVYRLFEVCQKLKEKYNFEIVIVNDGSKDRTEIVLNELVSKIREIKAIHLTRNFGHQAALSCGLHHSTGDAVFMMDADGEHPPEMMRDALGEWESGYKIVNLRRAQVQKKPWSYNLSSKLYYHFLNRISEVEIPRNVADFKLLDRSVVDAINKLNEKSRFLRGLTAWVGFKSATLYYSTDDKRLGCTSYSFKKRLDLAVDGIISFTSAPLVNVFWIGVVLCLLSGTYGFYVMIVHFYYGDTITIWRTLLILNSFIGGVIILSLGILGLYVSKIYQEVKARPLYLVEDIQTHKPFEIAETPVLQYRDESFINHHKLDESSLW